MEYTTIGEACTLHARIGWQGLTKSEYLDEGDYYLVTGVDFDNGHIAFDTCHFVTKERYDQDQHIQLRMNDVLVTKDGTIGKVAFIDKPIDKPATLNSGVFVVRPKEPALLLPEYLMIVLTSNHFSRFIEQIKVGCTIAHLNQEKFLRYQFPLPPIVEQRHIIEVYYSASKIINQRQRQLRTLDTLIKARFVEMFGEPVHNSAYLPTLPMTEVCEIIDGDRGKNYPKQEEFFDDEHCLFLNAKNVTSHGFDFSECMFITKEKDMSLRKGKLQRGDVVLTTRGTLGNLAFYTDDVAYENVRINSGMVILRMNRKMIDEDFFIEQFRMQVDEIKTSVASGSAQPQLPISTMNKINILVPDLARQRSFAAFVSQVGKSKLSIQQGLEKLETLKQSLMQQYFNNQ